LVINLDANEKHNFNGQSLFKSHSCPGLQTMLLIFAQVSCAALAAVTEFNTCSCFSMTMSLGMTSHRGRKAPQVSLWSRDSW